MKTCKGCEQELPYAHFYLNRNVKDGYANWCRPCFIARHRERKYARAAELRAYITAIKMERGCTDCGYRGHPAALEFDHLPGFVKEHRIATMSAGNTLAKIDAEIAKCEVVCANCHRVRTANRRAEARRVGADELDPFEGS